MKFLVVNDTHYTGKQPVSRLDNIIETLRKKTYEIRKIAEKNDVKAILHTGDFWDSPLPALSVAATFINAWCGSAISFEEGMDIEEADVDTLTTSAMIPTYGIIGNHDPFHKNIATINRTMLGFMNRLGIYNFLQKDKPLIFEENGRTIAITGCHYSALIDSLQKSDYVVEEKMGDVHIHLAHGSLTKESYGTLYEHTVISEIEHTKADVTLCGHEHVGFGIVEKDGKFYANVGSPFRMTADKKDMMRTPKVMLIDIDPVTGKITLEEVPLKSAKPWKDVLDRERLEEAKAKARALEEIANELDTAGEYSGSTAFEIIEEIIAKEQIPEIIKKRLLARLERSAEILDGKTEVVDASYDPGIEIDEVDEIDGGF